MTRLRMIAGHHPVAALAGAAALAGLLASVHAAAQVLPPVLTPASMQPSPPGVQSDATAVAPPPGWRLAGLPRQTLPWTRISPVLLDGEPAVRIDADRSYGQWVAVWPPAGSTAESASSVPTTLRWRWRLEQPLAAADLRRKEGDDTALKVCAMFDLPLAAVPFLERQTLRLARSLSGEPLPGATLCYVWDPSLPAGTLLRNAYTPRLRWIVAQGQGAPLATWRREQRDLRADFLRAFGDESGELPPLLAIAFGADADNTGGRSRGHLAGLELLP